MGINQLIMKAHNLFLIMTLAAILSPGVTAQELSDIEGASLDVFLSKEIMEVREMKNIKLVNSIGITDAQGLIVASPNFIYRIGYYAYQTRKVKDKTIESFCVIGSDVYYVSKSTLYKVDTDNVETKVMALPFSPKALWAGQEYFYAAKSIGKECRLYAFSPDEKKYKAIYTTESRILCVDELGAIICVLTEKSLVMINPDKKQYWETPINTKNMGELKSMAIDKQKGVFYFSSTNGIFRIYNESIQKVSDITGILCYDLDGMIVFNAEVPYVIRMRNGLLYPPVKGVPIEIKD